MSRKKHKGRLFTREAVLKTHHARRQKSGFARKRRAGARSSRAREERAFEACAPVDLRPGDRVVVRGRVLYSMGLIVGELGARVFTVVPCQCELCQLGRHIAVEGERHFARAAVRGVSELCVDELRAVDSDALTVGIQRGIYRAQRGT